MMHPEVLILLQPKPVAAGSKAGNDNVETETLAKKQRIDNGKGNGKGKAKGSTFQIPRGPPALRPQILPTRIHWSLH